MIARKIIYKGNITREDLLVMFDITRKIEITGELKRLAPDTVEFNLEGDPSMIKLVQHQIERKVKDHIKGKEVTSIPYQYYAGMTLINL